MLKEIMDEIDWAVANAYVRMAEKDYLSFILLIAQAEKITTLKRVRCSEYIIDYPVDRVYDKTREGFYLRYLNKNYSKDGYFYEGTNGIDDLSIEMMIYTHLWESFYFTKTLVRMSYILLGKGYNWNPQKLNWEFMKKEIINPLKNMNELFGSVLDKAYSSEIRNAFSHSLYTVDTDNKTITMRTKHVGLHTISFSDFQIKFLYSVLLMNSILNELERKRIQACKKNTTITYPFQTPDGISVQINAETMLIDGKKIPQFIMRRISE